MGHIKGWFLAPLAGLILGAFALPAVIAEGAFHIYRRPHPDSRIAEQVARATGSAWEDAEIKAADGVRLRAWLFRPHEPNGAGVLLLHGVADTRLGATAQADMLLRSGYSVLLPDSRGHGESGGKLIAYGILEAGDTFRWAGWLARRPGIRRIYGLGVSMGAANLIQSLPLDPGFRAIVADCPFATFTEIARDRMEQHSGIESGYWRPFVWAGFAYAHIRYGFEPWKASPVQAMRETHTPVLLIHGTADRNIPIRHSRELHAANPAESELWEVPGAEHVASIKTAPEDYRRRVLAWFAGH